MSIKRVQRIEWLDAAKGVTMLLVVLGHITNGYLTAKQFKEWSSLICGVHYWIYSFHMPLFMVLSGYVFYRAYCVNREQKKRRYRMQMMNIALLYFIFGLLKWVSQTLLVQFVAIPVTLEDLLYLAISPLEELWYLYVLFFLYLLAYGLEKIQINENVKLVGILCLSYIGTSISWTHRFPLDRILYYLLYFYLGISFAKRKDIPWRKGWPLYAISAVLSTFWILQHGDIRKVPVLRIAAALSLSLLFLGVMIKGSEKANKESCVQRACCFLGQYSLEIYVFHCYVIAAGRAFLPKMGMKNLFINVPILFVFGTFLPLAGAMVLKKAGIHAMLFRPAYWLLEAGARKKNNT